jgi:hypothetical protein
MKRITYYAVLFIVFSCCQNKKEKTNTNSESITNINEIVEAIIIQDSLDVFSKSKDSPMFCSELRKLNISIPEKNENGLIPPPPPRGIYITTLLSEKIIGERFSAKDSLFILEQNSNPEKLKIEKKLLSKLNSIAKEEALIKSKKLFTFYEMTIPVFSIDKQKAYVELDHHCSGLCGSGKALYLKKINGKWKIIEKWQTWIS